MKPNRYSALPKLLATALVFALPGWTSATEGVPNKNAPRTISGLSLPESVAPHPDGRVFVSEIGEFGKQGDGKITVVSIDGRTQVFADNLNDPKGIVLSGQYLYVTDVDRVLRIDLEGRVEVLLEPTDFARPPVFLNDVAMDANGTLYISDSGNEDGEGAAIHALSLDGRINTLLVEGQGIKRPNGLLPEAPDALLVVDFGTGDLFRLHLAESADVPLTRMASGFGAADGLARDHAGALYISDWRGGTVCRLESSGAEPRVFSSGHASSADIALSADGKHLLMPDMLGGKLVWLPLEQ